MLVLVFEYAACQLEDVILVNELLRGPSFALDENYIISAPQNEITPHILQLRPCTVVGDTVTALLTEIANVTLIFDADFPVRFAAGYVAVKNELIALCIGEFSPFLR